MATITAIKTKKTYRGTNKKDIITFPAKAGDQIKVKSLNGDDTITVKGGSKHSINTGNGTNKVYVKAGTLHTITGGKNTDKLYLSKGSVKTANLGAGNDVVSVTGGTLKSVNLGAGKNKLTVTGGTVSSVVGGSGKDIITVSAQKKITIKAGNGDNEITVTGIDNRYFSKVSTSIIKGGNGVDTVNLKKGGYNRVTTLDGDDIINVTGGSNVLLSDDGNDIITVTSKYANCVDAGNENDIITLKGKSFNNVICGGYGNDTIHMKNTNPTDYYNYLEGGPGNDTYHLYSLNTPVFLNNLNGNAGTNYKDNLVIHEDMSRITELLYDSYNDVLGINNKILIGNFSDFNAIKINSGSSVLSFSAGQVENLAELVRYNPSSFSYVSEARNNLYAIANNQVTDEIAQIVGYAGK